MAADAENHRPSEAVESLEGRLHALEQHLSVAIDGKERPSPAPERLRDLSRDVQDLADRSEAATDLLELHQKYHGELSTPTSADHFGAPSASGKLAIVNSCATSFPSTVSQLTSLEALPIPPSESLAALTNLTPLVANIALRQLRQAEELGELRSRTAALLQRRHASSILAVGDCWAEWEERLLRVEAAVRRAEAAGEAAKRP